MWVETKITFCWTVSRRIETLWLWEYPSHRYIFMFNSKTSGKKKLVSKTPGRSRPAGPSSSNIEELNYLIQYLLHPCGMDTFSVHLLLGFIMGSFHHKLPHKYRISVIKTSQARHATCLISLKHPTPRWVQRASVPIQNFQTLHSSLLGRT